MRVECSWCKAILDIPDKAVNNQTIKSTQFYCKKCWKKLRLKYEQEGRAVPEPRGLSTEPKYTSEERGNES